MGKKLGISLLVLIVAGCVLISAGLIVGGYFLLRAQKNYVAPTQSVTLPFESTAAPAQSVEVQMDKIQEQLSGIRGLSLKTDLQRALMTPAQLEDKVVNDFFKDYTDEDMQNDVQELSVLGLLAPDFDLKQFYISLYSEQIAGYYDNETKEMYVIADKGFGGVERMTYAHEFNHVLQDQNYDMEKGLKLDDDTCEADTEYCAAVTALIEGDSSLSEQQWFMKYGTNQDRQDIQSYYSNYSSPVYDSAPEYMKKDFLFPYQQGLEFVQSLYDADGWDGVTAAYANLPVTTEQIMHPQSYPDDKPVEVDLPDFTRKLGEGWTEEERNVMGEWYTYLILSSGRSASFQMDDDTSKAAAAGWGGDTYVYYNKTDSSDYLLVWQSTWDTRSDKNEFFDLAVRYGLSRWGIPDQKSDSVVNWTTKSEGSITLRQNADGVLWVFGSSQSVLDAALTLLPDFEG